MRPSSKQASEDSIEEISLPGSPRSSSGGARTPGSAAGGAGVEDEISGVFRFLCDYRLTTPPLSGGAQSVCDCGDGSVSVSGGSSVSGATGASMVTSRGVGAPPHTHTPMGSTTKLIADSRPQSKEWRCLPGFGSVMVALSLATSLANIIRLPTMVFLHGGGSFLAVYLLIAVVFGIPLVFLEVLLGQFSQEGTTKLWRAVPLLKGIGFLKVLACLLTSIYYPVLIAIALFYVVWSAKGPLPLPECKYLPYQSQGGILRRTYGESCLEHTLLTPPDQDPTWFGVNIALLFVIWVLVMLCLCRDGRSYRVSAFLLLTAAVAALVALFTEQLGISTRGLDKLLHVDLSSILNFDTWYFAVVQLFLSTQIGFGNITTASGRIYAKSNAFWITLVYMACNLVVGVGFTCLVYMWMSRLEDQGITIVASKVPELFVITFMYDVITRCFTYDVQLWAVIAFLAVIFAGLTSMMALVFTVTTTVIVESKERWKQWVITAGFCSICFLAGVICLLPEKLELVHMLEHYVVTRIVVITTAVELVGFVWIYGSHHLYTDFEFVLGYKLNFVWKIIWFITPLLIVLLQVWSLFSLPLTGTPGTIDPEWLYITGWAIFGASWMFFLIVAIWQIAIQVDYNICQKFVSSLKPSRNWGPVDPIQRHGWVVWREQCTLSGERDFTLKRRGTRDYTHSVRHAPTGTLSNRYYPTYSKNPEKSAIHDQMNGDYSINSVPNYHATQTTDVNVRGVGAPYTVQLPENQEIDHVCWRKDVITRNRTS